MLAIDEVRIESLGYENRREDIVLEFPIKICRPPQLRRARACSAPWSFVPRCSTGHRRRISRIMP